jgi:hypothetical protein
VSAFVSVNVPSSTTSQVSYNNHPRPLLTQEAGAVPQFPSSLSDRLANPMDGSQTCCAMLTVDYHEDSCPFAEHRC